MSQAQCMQVLVANPAQLHSLKKAQEDAASLTPEYVAANMSGEEAARLSRVRNIGIAVRANTPPETPSASNYNF